MPRRLFASYVVLLIAISTIISFATITTPWLLHPRVAQAATFTVTNTNDSGAGSLRQTILDANANPGLDTIDFNIPAAGLHTIQPLSALPTITDPVVMNGYTQPGAAMATSTTSATLQIELDGTNAGASSNGFFLTGEGSTIRGLVINRFEQRGIWIEAGGFHKIEGNYIGTDVTGTVALGNSFQGIRICCGSVSNTIGGATAGERNILSGNSQGVLIRNPNTNNNIVSGNYIGTDVTGSLDLGNARHGVHIRDGARENVIGGTADGERNVISGNGGSGVRIADEGTINNVVSGNYIGTDVTGTVDLGNNSSGVAIRNGAQLNVIGGSTAGERNIISGNDSAGVSFSDLGTDHNVVSGNYIGTDVGGTADLGNAIDGVSIKRGAQSNVIGGTTDGERNVISGSGHHAVSLADEGTNNNVVVGNYLGTDATGTVDLGNHFDGVSIRNGAQLNVIGGSTPGERNIISGNDSAGVFIADIGTDTNFVIGNYIGTDVSGTVDLGNHFDGVAVKNGARSNVIGGTTAGERNIISGNDSAGVAIQDIGSENNMVSGNYIGTDVTGVLALGNTNDGVFIGKGAQFNTIGGETPDGRNIISANNAGVGMRDAGTDNNVVSGNYIGTDVTGTADLGNIFDGIHIRNGAQSNMVGGETPGERNIISGNGSSGVDFADIGTGNNVVSGNYIGTDVTGTVALPNQHGVQIRDGAQSNTIGGPNTDERNIISGNNRHGVSIRGPGTDNNTVSGNYIGTDVSGAANLGNSVTGVVIGSGAQFNKVGGDTAGERNIISANGDNGVGIFGAGTNNNTVSGNYVGTDVSSTAALGNAVSGVVIAGGAQFNTIGGKLPGERNIVSGNAGVDGSGVGIFGLGTERNLVIGNYIGTDFNGTAAVANRLGVGIGFGAQFNTVGGSAADERNIISGNNIFGIWIAGGMGTGNNVVKGNFIGTDVSGTVALGNLSDGFFIAEGAHSNTIGGTTPGERNVVSGNGAHGVDILGAGTDNNTVVGNFIGTDVTGMVALPNQHGVQIRDGAQSNTIGGPYTDERNIISGNNRHGVSIRGTDTDNNTVSGNYIGTDLTGNVPLGNSIHGVVVSSGASDNTIGGKTAHARNLISANGNVGVRIGSGASDNLVQGNYIGTDATGSRALGNSGDGVRITEAANNTVAKNRSENNGGDGFEAGSLSVGNMFEKNKSRKNGGFGYLDASVGPANTYLNNKCKGNTLGGSSPSDLCKP